MSPARTYLLSHTGGTSATLVEVVNTGPEGAYRTVVSKFGTSCSYADVSDREAVERMLAAHGHMLVCMGEVAPSLTEEARTFLAATADW